MGNSNRGEAIKAPEKEKINDLSIYTCGNKKEINLFHKSEIAKENITEQYLDNIIERHPNYDWYFNYYLKELNEELINEILNNIINNYKTKKNYKNNLILIFFESCEITEENTKKIKMILESIDKMLKIYKPILLFAFKNNKMELELEEETEHLNNENTKNIIDSIIKENKFDHNFFNKFLEIVHYNANDYSEIIRRINSIFCYYNNIGDLFTILDEMIRGYNFYNNNAKNKTKFVSTFNILVMGRPGSGKSTLINLLLNETKAREGIGESVTKVVSKYVHNKYPITFEDTPGFEDNKDLDKMIKFLKNSINYFGKGKNKFHLILYIINGSNERTFIGEEVKLINFIQKNMKIPIFFVCTKCKNENYAKDIEEVIKINLWQNFGDKTNLVDYIFCCHLLNEKDGVYKRFGIKELLEGIQKYYKKELEKKEKELLENKETENEISSQIKIDFEDLLDESIFLNGLKNPENFETYLYDLSLEIIEKYKIFTYEQIKNSKQKNNNEEINLFKKNTLKISELLVDHLAIELNGKSKGNTFCKRNEKHVLANVNSDDIEPTIICWKVKTEDLVLNNGEKITDENIKKNIRITKEFGMEARKEFLNELRYNNNDLKLYLKAIIKSYKDAIESLTNLNMELKE